MEEATPDNPLETFWALAGDARYIWGLELQEAQGKGLEQVLAEDMGGEVAEELAERPGTSQSTSPRQATISQDTNEHDVDSMGEKTV